MRAQARVEGGSAAPYRATVGRVVHPGTELLEWRRPLRRREYDRLVEAGAFDDERIELLAGMLVAVSPQGAEHAVVVNELVVLLAGLLAGRAIVRGQSPLALSDESEPEPDVAVVPPGHYRDEHPAQALLVIEVADSSLRRDREVKAELYACAGVAEYWVVNLVDRVVEVSRTAVEGHYVDVSRLGAGQTLRPVAFPDVAIGVSELFGEKR
jgi:Uma2 family endonuclease